MAALPKRHAIDTENERFLSEWILHQHKQYCHQLHHHRHRQRHRQHHHHHHHHYHHHHHHHHHHSFIHSFIHSFLPFLLRPFKSFTTQRRSRLQHGYCIGVSRRSAQATVGKGLAQGPYVAARAGVEPTTLRLRVIASTNAPPCPTK